MSNIALSQFIRMVMIYLFVDENCLTHLLTISNPTYDFQPNSPIALRNKTQLSINTHAFTDDPKI